MFIYSLLCIYVHRYIMLNNSLFSIGNNVYLPHVFQFPCEGLVKSTEMLSQVCRFTFLHNFFNFFSALVKCYFDSRLHPWIHEINLFQKAI